MIRYENIHLHAQVGHGPSDDFRQWLEDNNVSFTYLGYEDPKDDLHAISTWFEGEPDFTSSPVLTFDQLMWEAEDGTDRYVRNKFAKSYSELPSDFLDLAQRVE